MQSVWSVCLSLYLSFREQDSSGNPDSNAGSVSVDVKHLGGGFALYKHSLVN